MFSQITILQHCSIFRFLWVLWKVLWQTVPHLSEHQMIQEKNLQPFHFQVQVGYNSIQRKFRYWMFFGNYLQIFCDFFMFHQFLESTAQILENMTGLCSLAYMQKRSKQDMEIYLLLRLLAQFYKGLMGLNFQPHASNYHLPTCGDLPLSIILQFQSHTVLLYSFSSIP